MENVALNYFRGQEGTGRTRIVRQASYFCSFTSPMPTIFAEVRNFL